MSQPHPYLLHCTPYSGLLTPTLLGNSLLFSTLPPKLEATSAAWNLGGSVPSPSERLPVSPVLLEAYLSVPQKQNCPRHTTTCYSYPKDCDSDLPVPGAWKSCLIYFVPFSPCFQWDCKSRESPLDCKEIKPVSPKGYQPWIIIGWTVAEAEAPIVWPPDAKSRLTRKYPDAGKDWRQKEKGMAEDEMVR